jgi:hypothetical protein
MMTESYGVAKEIHLEWYMPGEDQYALDTQEFALKLTKLGYDVLFVHGPIGLYENVILTTVSMIFDSDVNHLEDFVANNDKDYIYFLYQLKMNERRLRMARISNKDWEMIAEKTAASRKEKEANVV